MWNKIKYVPFMAHQAITSKLSGFLKDQRGLSGVVVAILLILVAVLAIVLIWGFLGGWLEELWDNITGKAGGIA